MTYGKSASEMTYGDIIFLLLLHHALGRNISGWWAGGLLIFQIGIQVYHDVRRERTK